MSVVNAEVGGTGSTAPPPLSRNRNYNVLWSSQVISELGQEISFIAFPLLILATSGSPLEMGIVAAATMVAQMLATIPGGVLADSWDRKKIMLMCEGVRALALGGLAVYLLFFGYSFAVVLTVAIIEGAFSAMFEPAEDAALPRVVPRSQLSNAVARNEARTYIAGLIGPAVGGFLFGVSRVMPFVIDAISYLVSFVMLLFLRVPRGRERAGVTDGGEEDLDEDDEDDDEGGLLDGFRWVLADRVIRATLIWVVVSNLMFNALAIIILAIAGEAHVGAGEIGLMMACFSAGGLLGAAVAARLHAAIGPSVIVIGFSWIAAVMTAVMIFAPHGIMLGVILGVVAFFAPVANTSITTYQMLVTPDEYRGRLSSLVGLCGGAAGALGPLLGGVLMSVASGSTGVLICSAGLTAIALGATLSPTLRRFPKLGGDTTPGPTPDKHGGTA
nr:major facilitator transporter [uncultured bacterium]